MNRSDFDEYRSFIGMIDKRVAGLATLHGEHMKCGRGCDLCCVAFSVFPVEYFHIREQMENEGFTFSEEDNYDSTSGRCRLLKDHLCSIYSHRPYICRTHGLPLVNMNEDGDEWELSFCELNFTEADDDYFDMDNTLEQDELNSTLYMINKRFLALHPELGLDEKTLIPLAKLIEKQ